MASVLSVSPTFGSTSPESLRELETAGHVVVRASREEYADPDLPALSGAAALVVGTERVDAAVLARAPALRVVAKHGAGVDNVDLDAARARGVMVTNAPGYNAIAVAEHTFALILALARDLPGQAAATHAGVWRLSVGQQLAGATLGVVGMGAIGRLVARRALAFEMRVRYADAVSLPAAEAELAGLVERVDLPTLLAGADVVTLHVPLTEETRWLIGAAELDGMRPSAILVNAARGGLVDEAALLSALERGHIAGAGLDVLAVEPPSDNPLLTHPRVVVTPHIAGYTGAALAQTSLAVAHDVVAVLDGRPPRHPVV